MSTLGRSTTVPVKCPDCGRTTQKALSELKADPQFTCKCGAIFKVPKGGFEAAGKSLGEVQKFGRRK